MATDYELNILSYIKPIEYLNADEKKRKYNLTKYQMTNMFRRTCRMFEWTGLPKTIPQRDLELLVQTKGVGGIIEHKGDYYCLLGSLGGMPNPNYMPTKYIVSNAALDWLSKEFDIYGNNKNVVIIPNDSLYIGLLPIISYHSEINTEIQLTKFCVLTLTRQPDIITAPDNNSKVAVDEFLKGLKDGRIASIFSKNILADVKSVPLGENRSSNTMTQLLELEQYTKAALFNDLGLQLNYNMKRESITSSEAQLGEGSLLPLCDDMLEQRQIACRELQETFGLDVTVDFTSAWKDLRDSIRLGLEKEKNEAKPQVITSPIQMDKEENNEGEVERNPNESQELSEEDSGLSTQSDNEIVEKIVEIETLAEDVIEDIKSEGGYDEETT